MQFGSRFLSLSKPRIMGVLNVTPDSFSDGGQVYLKGQVSLEQVKKKVATMVADGADIIDIGGESTRPGAADVGEAQECDRVLPVVEMVTSLFDVVVSVDTSTPKVMTESAKLGAGLINDVRALQREGALAAAAETAVPICLMHMQGAPRTMQQAPLYEDPMAEVFAFLQGRVQSCVAAGIPRDRLLVDPGIGFGKTDDHNLDLLKQLGTLKTLAPILLGVSRKSLFGRLLGRSVEARLAGSLALALRGVEQGAVILRVHDVAETADAIRMWQLTQP